MTTGDDLRMRLARRGDMHQLLELFDARVAWLQARGRSGQWGRKPLSELKGFRAQLAGWISSGATWIATDAAGNAGTVTLGDAPAYVPSADVLEIYVHALATRPSPPVPGVGASLLHHVEKAAVARGVQRLRLDCWAGGDGALVAYYQRQGYEVEGQAVDGSWHGVVLVKSVTGLQA